MRKALETQMNADVAQMNVLQSRKVLGYVHLRYICVHPRFHSPLPAI